MKPPYTFGYRNLLFGASAEDVWAVYRIQTASYAGLGRADKLELLGALASFAYGIEADFSLLRVSRPWSVSTYTMGVQAITDVSHHAPRGARRPPRGAADGSGPPRVARARGVCLGPAAARSPVARRGAAARSARSRRCGDTFGLDDARGISRKRLDELLDQEDKTFARVFDFLDAERAASHEIQWLIRRAFCRGLGDPDVDERFLPQALVVDAPEEAGGARFQPLEADVLRLHRRADQRREPRCCASRRRRATAIRRSSASARCPRWCRSPADAPSCCSRRSRRSTSPSTPRSARE